MSKNKVAWWLWVVSTALIALTWFGVVSMTVGWVGFGMGLFASFLSWGIRPPRSPAPPDDNQAPKD
jgi:hypothetical protein